MTCYLYKGEEIWLLTDRRSTARLYQQRDRMQRTHTLHRVTVWHHHIVSTCDFPSFLNSAYFSCRTCSHVSLIIRYKDRRRFESFTGSEQFTRLHVKLQRNSSESSAVQLLNTRSVSTIPPTLNSFSFIIHRTATEKIISMSLFTFLHCSKTVF